MTTPRALRALVVATLIAFGVVAVTGLVLSFRYLPEGAEDDTTLSDVLGPIHEVSAYVTLLLVVLLAASALARVVQGTWQPIALVVGGIAIALIGLVVGIVRGARLAWDQLALWAVTAEAPRGVWLSDTVRFVVRDSVEVGVGDYRRDVWIHVVVAPLLAVVGIATVVLAIRSRRDPAPSDPPQSDQAGSATKVTSASS
jgi:Domain of unknown function (DUF4405)